MQFLLVTRVDFLRAKAATAFSHLRISHLAKMNLNLEFSHFRIAISHRNSVRLSVRLCVTQVDQSKTVQARITKSSLSAVWKTLVSGTAKFFHKFEGGHPKRGR